MNLPVNVTIVSEFMGQPLPLPPFEIQLLLDGMILIDDNQIVVTQSIEQDFSTEITDFPGGDFSDIPLMVPTVLPAGQIANLLLSAVFQTGTSDLNLTATLIAEGDLILPGDVNGDGLVNLLDVAPFVDALVAGSFNASADVNCDGVVNLLDVAPFISLLNG